MNRDDGFEYLRTLFAADLLEKLKALEDALRDADWDEVSAIAHKIRGTAKSFGYPEVSNVAADLENSSEYKSLEHSAALVKKISDLVVL